MKSQEIQVKAILARFNGDKTKAANYCTLMAVEYEHVAQEYYEYLALILGV